MKQLICITAASAMALIPLTAAQAATKTAIDKPGAYCFQFGDTEPGATRRVLTLDIDPSDHPAKQRLWWASGVETASNPDDITENWVTNLNGTATVAKPNNGKPGPKLVHIALTGTSYGQNDDPNVTGVWAVEVNLQLNRKTLKGNIVGVETFTPIAGETAGAQTTLAINYKIKPISCKKA